MHDEEVFDQWNVLKKVTDSKLQPTGFKVRDIWFAHMGKNVGYEEDGKGEEFLRPVLVCVKFNTYVFWGIPLTGTHKTGRYYHALPPIRGKQSTLILSQMRLYDARRLKYKIGVCPLPAFAKVKEQLHQLLRDDQILETPAKAGEARRRL